MKQILKLTNPFQLKKWDTTTLNKLTTTEILEKLNYIRKQQSGFYQQLPLYLRVNNKIQKIITKFLQSDELGAVNLQLNLVSFKKIWEISGRWPQNSIKKEMFTLIDNNKQEKCLVPTCEEDITYLMKNYIKSYRDLPFVVYQINSKFRDELRPKNGVLRSKEFLMMDAYSFTKDSHDSRIIYDRVNHIYAKIFESLKIPFVKVWANNGNMGGDISQEYHLINPLGEDILFKCSNNLCGNITTSELTESLPAAPTFKSSAIESDSTQEHKDICNFDNARVRYLLTKDNSKLICLYYPGDKMVNWTLVQKQLDKIDPNIQTILELDHTVKAYTSDEIFGKFENDLKRNLAEIIQIVDLRCQLSSNLELHEDIKKISNFKTVPMKKTNPVSIVNATDGEICPKCQIGELKSMNSIEIGHTFILGEKYSKPFKLNYVNEQNDNKSLVQMGCYGIGISRLIGAMADFKMDSMGLNWPLPMAPYILSICQSTKIMKLTDDKDTTFSSIQEQLDSISFLQDEIYHFSDSNINLNVGSQIQISHALGIPIVVILHDKIWPKVEVEVRDNNINIETLLSLLKHISLKDKKFQFTVSNRVKKVTKIVIPNQNLGEVITTIYHNMS